jgi:nitrogen fixation NifU-like protein
MSTAISDELYQQVILDNNRSPHNFRKVENATYVAEGLNPLCGDGYTIYITMRAEGVIKEVAFHGAGCAISKASGSLMTDALVGMTVAEAEALFTNFHELVLGENEDKVPMSSLGKLRVFAGVWRYPARVKCAALPWHAMRSALHGESRVSTEDKM